jgi:outer membrane protein assembly factor BamB
VKTARTTTSQSLPNLFFWGLFLFLAAGAGAQGADWPRWRGADGNGVSPETEWNPKAINSHSKIAWTAAVGTGFSSVAVKGQRLYTLGNDNEKDTIYCLDANTGRKVWSYSYPCGLGGYPGPRATPTIDEGFLFTLSREGHLFCLDAETGKVRWARHLVKDFGANPPMWDFAGSPVVYGDLLVLNAGESGIALDKKSGEKLWGEGGGPSGYATPVIAQFSGKPSAVLFGRDAVRGVELSRGAVEWSFPWRTDSDVNAADPLVLGTRIFVASAYGHGCALYDVGAGKPSLAWESRAFQTHFSSFVAIDGFIYGIDGDARQFSAGTLRCLDARTGKEAWSARLGFGSLIAAGGRLIVLNAAGTIITAEAMPAAFKEISRGPLPRNQYWTPPAFARGMLYVRNLQGDLFAIDMR